MRALTYYVRYQQWDYYLTKNISTSKILLQKYPTNSGEPQYQ